MTATRVRGLICAALMCGCASTSPPWPHERSPAARSAARDVVPPAPLRSAAGAPEVVTLEEALRAALDRHPELQASRAQVDEARGRLLAAATYPFNPTLSGRAGARRGSGDTSADFEVGVEQEVEVAGQRAHRVEAARREVSAEEAALARARRLLEGEVHLAFVDALAQRDRLELGRSEVELAERLHDLQSTRLSRGAGTQLEVNTAAAELGSAEARARSAEGAYRAALAALAEAMAADPADPPAPVGELSVSLPPAPPLDDAVRSALVHRGDLRALHDVRAAARARHSLARAAAWPDVTLGAFVEREGDMDTIIGGGISIPIPIFDRNQGEIAASRAAMAMAGARLAASELDVRRDVAALHARHAAAAATAESLEQRVVGTLEESLELLERAFEAGRLGWAEVLVIRRTLIEARRRLIAARAEARRTWIALRIATGRPPVALAPEEEP